MTLLVADVLLLISLVWTGHYTTVAHPAVRPPPPRRDGDVPVQWCRETALHRHTKTRLTCNSIALTHITACCTAACLSLCVCLSPCLSCYVHGAYYPLTDVTQSRCNGVASVQMMSQLLVISLHPVYTHTHTVFCDALEKNTYLLTYTSTVQFCSRCVIGPIGSCLTSCVFWRCILF